MGEQQIFGVTFRKAALGFWDIYFPPLPPDKETAGRTLMGCKECGTRKVVHLDAAGLGAYNANRQVSLQCSKCGKATVWLGSQLETTKPVVPGPANAVRLAPAPSHLPENQRRHRRVAAEIPVCVRQAGAPDDVGTTVDISRGGLRFTSHRHHPAGSFIQVAVPYSPTAVNVFVEARVAHSSRLPEQGLYQFGIMYLAENDPST